MYLIVGLGNPGPQYATTRHNVGFMVIDEIARRHKLTFTAGRGRFLFCRYRHAGEDVCLLKPTSFMNHSGAAVVRAVNMWAVQLEHVRVVYDDFQLPFGTLRFRKKGSAGGHNGMASIITQLRSENFPRLRVGIGTGKPIADSVNFVLSSFSESEMERLPKFLEIAADALETSLSQGLDRAMNLYNRNVLQAFD